MLLNLILALVGVIFLFVHDWAQEKSGFSIKNHWVKYVSALILGIFLFSYFVKWEYAQYAEQVGAVILFGLFFNTIVNVFTKSGVKGIPKDPNSQ